MPQRTARRFVESKALAGFWPAIGIPFLPVVDAHIAVAHVVVQLRHPIGKTAYHDIRLNRARGDAAHGGIKSRCRLLKFG